MSDLLWRRGDAKMIAFHRTIDVSNKFYEILTETPGEHVVQSTNQDGTDGVPYKPEAFPVGIWNIRMPQPRTSIYTAPYFIPTDAHQLVDEWELDEHQLYKCPAGRQVMDWGYGIHHSQIDYTFGCLRVLEIRDIVWLVGQLNQVLIEGQKVTLEVVA
jgi:hypothetical protein